MPDLHERSTKRPAIHAWLFPLAVLASGLTGCATTNSGQHPAPRLAQPDGRPIGVIGVLPPDITLRELSAGGAAQQRDDWSESAREIARQTVGSLRPERFVYYVDENVPDDIGSEIEDVQALYRTIDLAVTLYHMGVAAPPTATGLRGQSLGSVDHIAALVDADALLLVFGLDDIFTTDRKILAGLGVVAAAFTGVHLQPSGGSAHISAALVAREGRILWFNRIGQEGISDLRTPEGVRRTLSRLLATMPQGTPPALASSDS